MMNAKPNEQIHTMATLVRECEETVQLLGLALLRAPQELWPSFEACLLAAKVLLCRYEHRLVELEHKERQTRALRN